MSTKIKVPPKRKATEKPSAENPAKVFKTKPGGSVKGTRSAAVSNHESSAEDNKTLHSTPSDTRDDEKGEEFEACDGIENPAEPVGAESCDENVTRQTGNQKGCLASSSSAARTVPLTFGSVYGKKDKGEEKAQDGVFLEDLDAFRVTELPTVCEVTEDHLQDEALQEDYEELPPLRQGSLVSWKPSSIGPGHPSFSEFWSSTIPDMRIGNCVSAIRFDQCGRYVNPSRASPLVVNSRRMSADGRNIRLYVNNMHAICVTCISTTESFLYNVPPSGLRQKQLRGIVHSQEWERLAAFFCMVFRQTELSAQLFKDALSFTTKVGENVRQEPGMYKRSTNVKGPPITTNASSRRDPFLLECAQDVPVYDGRDGDIDLNTDIKQLKTKLKKFDGEIPQDSFAVVGYTANCYHSSKDSAWHLSLNIMWAIVMGTPDM